MQAIILSGGRGTRLHPLTLTTPKPMLPINGIPHLEYQIRLLAENGIKDIIFSTGYLHEQIEQYFGDGNKFGVMIKYKEDGDSLLGTAGAVRNCLELIQSDDVLIMNGDILTNISLSRLMEVHGMCKMPITMTLLEVADATGFGLTSYNQRNGKLTMFLEKPEKPSAGAINAGIYIINKEVIGSIPENQYAMLESDVFPRYATAGMIQGMVCIEGVSYWLDIGTHERYTQAQEDAKKYF